MLICYNSGFSTICNRYALDNITLDFSYICNDDIRKNIISIINLSKY
jgi:hypothetical protein